jgi:hypothetical protein
MKQDYRWQTPRLAVFNLILMEFGDFAMERRMLKGIKFRAERIGRRASVEDANEYGDSIAGGPMHVVSQGWGGQLTHVAAESSGESDASAQARSRRR